MSDPTPPMHPPLSERRVSGRKTVVLKFAPPGAGEDARDYLARFVGKLEPLVTAHEGVVRELDAAALEAHIDLPRKQAMSFKTQALELLGSAVTATEFEDTTKPRDQELGAGQ